MLVFHASNVGAWVWSLVGELRTSSQKEKKKKESESITCGLKGKMTHCIQSLIIQYCRLNMTCVSKRFSGWPKVMGKWEMHKCVQLLAQDTCERKCSLLLDFFLIFWMQSVWVGPYDTTGWCITAWPGDCGCQTFGICQDLPDPLPSGHLSHERKTDFFSCKPQSFWTFQVYSQT